MATVDQPRHKTHAPAKPGPPKPAKAKKKKSRAFRYGCWFMLLLLVAGGYFAPWIISYTPLRHWALATALELDGQASVDSLSLDWFSTIEAHGVEIRDAAGGDVIKIESMHTDKPLVGMLLDLSDLGHIRVEHPTLHVVVREKDTNLEEVFASLIKGPPVQSLAALQLEVTDATLIVDDVVANRSFQIVQASLNCKLDDEQPAIELTASGKMADKWEPGTFQVELQAHDFNFTSGALGSGKIDCQVTAIPLELAEPVVRRFAPESQLVGNLSTRLNGGWGQMAAEGGASLTGETLVTEFAVKNPRIGAESLRLDRIEFPCQISHSGNLLIIERCSLACELGNVSLSGSVKTSDFSADNPVQAFSHENYEAQAQLDLAQLARLIPEVLHLRQGLEVTSGQITLNATSRRQPEGMVWSGHVDAGHLGGQVEGRSIVWENPLAIDFATRETQQGVVLDRLKCTSSFLEVDAAGSIDDLTASAKFDLACLASEAKQFTDLGGVQLAGQGDARLELKRAADNALTAFGTFEARGFQFTLPGSRPWTEDLVVAKLEAGGKIVDAQLKQIDRAQLAVEVGSEKAEATLEQAVTDLAAAWPLRCTWTGQLAHSAPRLEACLGISGWDFAGGGSVTANVSASPKAIAIESATAELTQLRATGHGWQISEATAAGGLSGRYDLAKQRLEIDEGKLTAGSVNAVARQVALARVPDGWALDGGSVQLAAELAEIYAWRRDPRFPPAWQVSGRLNSRADAKYGARTITATVDGTVDQLQIVAIGGPPSAQPRAWREEQVVFAAGGSYQLANARAQLDKLQVNAGAALQCSATGTAELADQGMLDLKGTIQYDWEQLSPLLRPLLGASIAVAGRQSRPFSFQGHLPGDPTSLDAWRQMTGEASVGWTGMNVQGLAVGPGEVAVILGDGRLATKPIDVEVSGGRLTLSPVIRLSSCAGRDSVRRRPAVDRRASVARRVRRAPRSSWRRCWPTPPWRTDDFRW